MKNNHIRIPIQNCNIQYETFIYQCTKGFWRNQMKFTDSESYNMKITRTKCQDILAQNEYRDRYNENVVVTLNNNQGKIEKFIYGIVAGDNSCEGMSFISYNKQKGFNNALLFAKITVKVKTEEATLNLETAKVKLPNGSEHNYELGSASSEEDGQTFWNIENINQCDQRKFTSLYIGMGTQIKEVESNSTALTYLVNDETNKQSFMIEKKTEINLCGTKTLTTSALDIYIRTNQGEDFTIPQNNILNLRDISLSHYHTIKLLSINNNLNDNIQELYSKFKYELCQIKHQLIQTIISLIPIVNSMEIPMLLFNINDAIAVQNGEVISLIKCEKMECNLRLTEQCYHELPAICNSQKVFLSPRTRLITETGTVSTRSKLIPNYYNINNNWITVTKNSITITPFKPLDIVEDTFQWKFLKREDLIKLNLNKL